MYILTNYWTDLKITPMRLFKFNAKEINFAYHGIKDTDDTERKKILMCLSYSKTILKGSRLS